MQRSETINELATALARAQGQIENAAKDAANPFFKSKYADLASCWDACRKALSANGLAVIQMPSSDAGLTVTITTVLAHASGQWIAESLQMPCKEPTPQAVGSTITYARRYSLCAMVGVAPEDDDGNAGSGRGSQQAADAVAQRKIDEHRKIEEHRQQTILDVPEELRPIFVRIRKDRGAIPDAYMLIQKELSKFDGGLNYYDRVADAFAQKFPKGASTAEHEKCLLGLWEEVENLRDQGTEVLTA